jgi:putative SOS response-associated peptidase YedK
MTTQANELIASIHSRMPVVLPHAAYDLWLDPAVKETRKLLPLLRPYPADEMEAYQVGRLVNDPAIDRAECIRRVG